MGEVVSFADYLATEPIQSAPTLPTEEDIAEVNYFRALLHALDVRGFAQYPIQCATNFFDIKLLRESERNPQTDKLFVLLPDNRAYDLDRAAAFEAYDAYVAGDERAMDVFLASSPMRIVPEYPAANSVR